MERELEILVFTMNERHKMRRGKDGECCKKTGRGSRKRKESRKKRGKKVRLGRRKRKKG